MVRGKAFYAVWDAENEIWSTDEYDVQRMVDNDLYSYYDKIRNERSGNVSVKSMRAYSSNSWKEFKKYLTQIPDCNHTLDSKLAFANTKIRKSDYISKRLPYSLEPGDISAYDEIIGTLYSKEERAKIEWAIGSIVAGDSQKIQKFLVLYGEAGAGKSTILNIIQQLFDGYYTMFEAKALTSNSNSFSTEVFKNNPLVAIQHDGDLSRIEDNSKLNSIISHEEMVINEKFKSSYTARMNCFLFMATNRPVKITDAKSGIIRRLIDVKPSGNKLPPKRYHELMAKVDFELGAIAQHCLEVYTSMGKNFYSDYRPFEMMYETDVFYNFVEANYDAFAREDEVSLRRAYAMYKEYCEEALVEFKLPMHKFRAELKEYFREFFERAKLNGNDIRSLYRGFRKEKFIVGETTEVREPPAAKPWLEMNCTKSLLDDILAECPAQYSTEDGVPTRKWANVETKLSDIDTTRLHYVKPEKNHIVIDFDLKNAAGEKDAQLNLAAAAKFPQTYGEFSQGGSGVHLHYIFDGDAAKLQRVYSEGIEIKVFTGNSSLRRRLSRCNDLPIAHISSGLPMKGDKVIDFKAVKSERKLRELINRNLKKEIHAATKPSVDFIYKLLDDAYNSDLSYDLSDMRPRIFSFAAGSTNQAEACIKAVMKMHFRSKDFEAKALSESMTAKQYLDERFVFYDVEVFSNLLLINWKFDGDGTKCVRMINPTPEQVGELFRYKLIGFNCRRYDNHILYARYLGYTNQEIYDLSQKIVNGDRNAMFGEAYNISYTDVYDFSSEKQSLKKFEIELGIHHQELGLPWDQPVDESLWTKVAEYCDNDVIATEAVFHARKADWTARQILASVAGMTVNDTTNSLTTRIIFGSERKPQGQFNYRFMGTQEDEIETYRTIPGTDPNYTVFDGDKPIFPGYTFDMGKSIYRGEEVGEGGYVYAEPGMHFNVALLDIASMHPSSIVAEDLFGPIYTQRFNDILQTRIAIKHGEFDRARSMLDGKLAPYLEDESTAKDLAQALKIAINSVYGLTSAKFENPFRDIRNKDNIVAKRGALFMINLKHEVQSRGFTVAHIKTDSIKIPNATPEIISFVQEYGKYYGYNFEHEATYDRMCLVNDAVYIAKYKGGKHDGEWTATGAQFAQPYVFKTLFSREPIDILDMTETKTVTSALFLDMNEKLPEGEHDYRFIGKTGLFCPILPGHGGGELLREKDRKFHSATGAKGYRWLEYEYVKQMGMEQYIDRSYYRAMVDRAVEDIARYGDFEMFVGGAVGTFDWRPPCGDSKYATCFECERYLDGGCEFMQSKEGG